MKINRITKCRVCGCDELHEVLDLGNQELTGVFPKDRNTSITSGRLDLLFCEKCGLLQLGNSFDLDEMYGDNYGYRSGLNQSMVNHLSRKINMLESMYGLEQGDVVLDIGSNDGTSLNSYRTQGIRRIGMDPTGAKFKEYYNEGIELIPDFFSSRKYMDIIGEKAKIVTSFSMFYDLESPVRFALEVGEILSDDGVWCIEQSYMPTMLRNNSYDTVCHEHLEYYSLGVIDYIAKEAGLQIIDVSTNDINGGSFSVVLAKQSSSHPVNKAIVEWYLESESNMNLNRVDTYIDFSDRVKKHREEFVGLLNKLKNDGKNLYGYGASTKGNVILQYCGIGTGQISEIGEVNPDKYGAFTPGTGIPIVDEKQIKEYNPDYLVVLPWHFRSFILEKEKEYLESGGHFIFPLPYIEIV